MIELRVRTYYVHVYMSYVDYYICTYDLALKDPPQFSTVVKYSLLG